MNNPFESIEARLANIESLLLDLKHNPQKIQQSPPSDKLLCVEEAAEFLKLAVATVYTKVHRGEIPHMKTGKKLYFSQEELLNFVKSGRKKSNSEIEVDSEKFISKNSGTR